MSRARALTDEAVSRLRKWRALPRGQRPRTLAGMAAVMGISFYLAKRATYRQRAYAKVLP